MGIHPETTRTDMVDGCYQASYLQDRHDPVRVLAHDHGREMLACTCDHWEQDDLP